MPSIRDRLQRQQSQPPRTALGVVWMLQAVAENRGTVMSEAQELEILRAFRSRK